LELGDLQAGKVVGLEQGRYVVDPDGDPATSLRVTFDVAAAGWNSWIGAAKFDSPGPVVLNVTTVENLVRDGCHDQVPAEPPVGPTVDDLATALTRLAPFEVTAQPSDVTVLGYRGKHLQLTVPDLAVAGEGEGREFADCLSGELHSWISHNLDGSFWGYLAEPGRTEDFWILDVAGTRLVLTTLTSPETSRGDLAELQNMFDSVDIEP